MDTGFILQHCFIYFLLQRKSEAKSLLKSIENKRSGKVVTLGTLPTASTATVTNADTTVDDDMEMELSDYKFIPKTFGLNNNHAGTSTGNIDATATSFKSSTTTNEAVIATNISKSLADGPSSTAAVQRLSSGTTDEMSLSESDILTTSSIVTTNTPSNANVRRTESLSTNSAADATQSVEEEDEYTQSMEMSSISID